MKYSNYTNPINVEKLIRDSIKVAKSIYIEDLLCFIYHKQDNKDILVERYPVI